MSRRNVPSLLLLVALVLPLVGQARMVQLVRSQRKNILGQAAQAARFLQSYTTMQQDQPPFERFRFKPTDADIARIRKLQAGGIDTVVRSLSEYCSAKPSPASTRSSS